MKIGNVHKETEGFQFVASLSIKNVFQSGDISGRRVPKKKDDEKKAGLLKTKFTKKKQKMKVKSRSGVTLYRMTRVGPHRRKLR